MWSLALVWSLDLAVRCDGFSAFRRHRTTNVLHAENIPRTCRRVIFGKIDVAGVFGRDAPLRALN